MILLFAGCDHVNVMAKDDGSNELCKFRTSEGYGIDIVVIFDAVELYDTEFTI